MQQAPAETLKLVRVFLPHEFSSTRYKYTTDLYGRKIKERYTTRLTSGEDLCVLSRPVQLYLAGLYNCTLQASTTVFSRPVQLYSCP